MTHLNQSPENRRGKVYLVGSGPGDPGLLTLRGLELLQAADLVLYDGLVNPHLLNFTSATTERTARTNHEGTRILDQDQINQRLVEAAREGKMVVRLKGGDPLVFGRGAEEAATLKAAGIPFEIIPGVTAAIAAGAYAGISLTHRNHASCVAFITGHEDPTKSETSLDYEKFTSFPGTLVFYMGLHRLEEIVKRLVDSGKSESTPVAVISHGTRATQKTITGDLSSISQKVRSAQLRPPSLIIIGDVVPLRETIQWFEDRPLFGLKIGIPRSESQQDSLLNRIYELGAEPSFMPVIDIQPPLSWEDTDRALDHLDSFRWLIFTSSNGVEYFLSRLWKRGGDARSLGQLKIAAIGPGTAAALHPFGLRADLIPKTYRAEGLAAELKPLVQGAKVLWVRANRGRDLLNHELIQAGADLQEVIVYRNEDLPSWPPEITSQLERNEIDWIPLSSPSIARNVARLLPKRVLDQLGESPLKFASISPITTAAAISAGLPISAEATLHTWDGLLNAIITSHAAKSQP